MPLFPISSSRLSSKGGELALFPHPISLPKLDFWGIRLPLKKNLFIAFPVSIYLLFKGDEQGLHGIVFKFRLFPSVGIVQHRYDKRSNLFVGKTLDCLYPIQVDEDSRNCFLFHIVRDSCEFCLCFSILLLPQCFIQSSISDWRKTSALLILWCGICLSDTQP